MNMDVYARVIEREMDLIISPWDTKLVISTRPITLSDQMTSLKQRNMTLENGTSRKYSNISNYKG